MIENRNTVLTNFEPFKPGDAESTWAGHEPGAGHAAVRGKRILLVEDEEPLRACLRMMLELEGHRVTEATDGANALHLFAPGQFDLVITDFQMPVMKGNKLATSLKLLAPSLPILMVTASANAHRDAQNPVDALLNKPFMVTDLRSAMAKLFTVRSEFVESSVVPGVDAAPPTSAPEAPLLAQLQA